MYLLREFHTICQYVNVRISPNLDDPKHCRFPQTYSRTKWSNIHKTVCDMKAVYFWFSFLSDHGAIPAGSRGLSHYLSDRNDDVNVMVDFYVGKRKKLRSSYSKSQEVLDSDEETKDLPDLEVPNWNIVHNAESAKIEMDDNLFKEHLSDTQVDSHWLKTRKVCLHFMPLCISQTTHTCTLFLLAIAI